MALDLETTGLDPEKGHIIEVAWIVGRSLSELAYADQDRISTCVAAYRKPVEVRFDPYPAKMHADTGLLDEFMHGGRLLHGIEDEILASLSKVVNSLDLPEAPPAVLVGNSVHFDHEWIAKHMPRLDKRLHYRHVDLTSDWILGNAAGIKKLDRGVGTTHRAHDDVATTLLQLRDALDIREHAMIYREDSDWRPSLYREQRRKEPFGDY